MVGPSVNTTPLSKRHFINTRGLGNDRLSSLPGHLLSRILYELPTKDSIRTRVLSKSWKDIWLDVRALDLNFNHFENGSGMKDFIDRFLEASNGLDRLELIYDKTYGHSDDDFVSRIHDLFQQKVPHLTVVNRTNDRDGFVRMPLSLYSCATLVDIHLYGVVFNDPGAELVSLPCVKTMYLEGVTFDFYILETLTASCPILDDLTIITHANDEVEVVCVRSHSLKTFRLESRRHGGDPSVEIDVPKLESMVICDYEPGSFVIHSIGPCAKVDIDIIFEEYDDPLDLMDAEFDVEYDDSSEIIMLQNFLVRLSTVSEMTISSETLEVISEVESLPQFANLSHLEVLLDASSSWECLTTFLGCCTNLKSLVVEIDYLPSIVIEEIDYLPTIVIEEIEYSPVPQCVLSSLEFVQLKTPETQIQMKLAAYFMKNCAISQNCNFEVSGNIIKKIKEI